MSKVQQELLELKVKRVTQVNKDYKVLKVKLVHKVQQVTKD